MLNCSTNGNSLSEATVQFRLAVNKFDQTMVMCDVEFDLNARQPSVTLSNQRPFVLPSVVTSLRLMTAYSRDNCFYIAARIGL